MNDDDFHKEAWSVHANMNLDDDLRAVQHDSGGKRSGNGTYGGRKISWGGALLIFIVLVLAIVGMLALILNSREAEQSKYGLPSPTYTTASRQKTALPYAVEENR